MIYSESLKTASDSIFDLNPHVTSFDSFRSVTEKEVKEAILKMPKKSCELDPIPSSLFFSCLDELLPFVTDIINASLASGSVPLSFKHASVKPLLKKSNLDPECLKNYRPVSNLPFISKLLERIVLSQCLEHLYKHELFEPFQSAYRKGHSTETALLRIVNDLMQASDKGKVSILSLLDLSAAFDTIDHAILIQRLSRTFGFSGIVLSWFESYLTNRTQSVTVNDKMSSPSSLKYGVPQGSVLGPILFSLYIQPLSSIIKPTGFSYHFFADDSQIYDCSIANDFQSLVDRTEITIDNVAVWMNSNMLKMNDGKTEVIPIGTKTNLKKTNICSINISSSHITFSDSVRNLGLFLDQNLTMEKQVNHLCKTLYLQLRRLSKIRSFLSTDAAKKLAVSFILSRLDYCNSLLIGIPQEKILKLQRIQNFAARLVLRKSKYDNSTQLLKALHWLPVKARIEYKIATLCFQTINCDTSPGYLKELLQPYTQNRALRSNSFDLLMIPKFKLDSFGKRAFAASGPIIWNSLPKALKKCKTINSFKNELKTFLFRKYF